MASIANTIYRFESGNLTNSELLAQVDTLLATDKANSARLKVILDDERTKTLLPADVLNELRNRIDEPSHRDPNDPASTAMQVDTSGTQSYRNDKARPAAVFGGADDEEAERMKGIGESLNGRFVLEECIGFGGMGTVYKALDLRKLEASDRNPYIAIKVLNVQFRGHPKSLIALQREAKKAQTLAHPNIVAVYDFDRDGTTVYLTMEYLDGKPLSHMLRNPEFTGMAFDNAMRIVAGMARALAYSHERGFVHCDFKPANVIVTEKGEIKVIDFGIARVFRTPVVETEVTVFDPGSLGGLTPAYASTEMLEHRDPDPRDDIYALGCITYELLTGRHPFDRLTATQARNAGMKPQRPKNLNNAQWRGLRNAMAFERDARTPTVMRFLEDMGIESRKSGSAVLLVATTMLATLVAGGAVYWFVSPGDRAEPPPLADAPVTPPAEPASTPEPAIQQAAPAPPAQPVAPPTVASVNQALSRIPCSALIATAQNDSMRVEGFVAASYGAARVKSLLEGAPGARPVALEVQQVSEEKCGILNLLAPYWTAHRQAGGRTAIHTRPRDARLMEGDKLMLDVNTPGHVSYVNVDYYSFDGNVVHLVPSPRARANQAPPNYSATIGGLTNWIVSKPFGTDLIVLLATPVPLFDPLRPVSESTPAYLAEVGKRLAGIAEKEGREKIAVDFLQVTTRPRAP
ncbi:serine/threonine protein kinase [Noviherbaspirillum sp.]|uniref:serine/threonine protein kinase n=1 Tax=Noviherbaspirillum sp. TaxID=1926288 RepID=UPI002FE1EC8A